jgi:hypothetical protein
VLKIIDPKIKRDSRTKTVEKYEDELTITKKYMTVRASLFEGSDVSFGAEDVLAQADFMPDVESSFREIEGILVRSSPRKLDKSHGGTRPENSRRADRVSAATDRIRRPAK